MEEGWLIGEERQCLVLIVWVGILVIAMWVFVILHIITYLANSNLSTFIPFLEFLINLFSFDEICVGVRLMTCHHTLGAFLHQVGHIDGQLLILFSIVFLVHSINNYLHFYSNL